LEEQKMRKMRGIAGAIVILALLSSNGFAALIDLGPGSFTPAASVITFDTTEVPLGTTDPVYNFVALPGLGNVTVSFGGYFNGQAAGGSPPTLTDPTPDNPLALDASAPATFTTMDGANPGSPVLSGTPLFAGTIAVLFSTPVAGVGLQAGYFDAIGSTTIEAYDATGASLGSIVNSQLGLEFYGLADSSGANIISGISFYITGNEPAGYAINDLTFGAAGVINNGIPAPGALVLVSLGTGLVGLMRRRRAI
jgi:hypothetical protein